MIKEAIRKLVGRHYQTLNLIEISRSALIKNYRFFQNLNPQTKVCPVLKSNAYGHGLRLVAKLVDREIKPPFIGVDSLYEAYELEREKIKTPILIMGYTFPQNFKISKRLNFTFPVYDLETIEVLSQHQPEAKVHLKIDTGMNRLGIKPEEARDFIRRIKKEKKIKTAKITGIYSHLAQASNPERKSFTQKQIKIFKEVIKIFEQEGFRFKWRHIAATAGAVQIKDPEFNLARIGLGFYGLSPFPERSKLNQLLKKSLKPALKLISHIVQIKEIRAGEQVSYQGSFTAKKKTKIAILPLGYYDGLDRRLSNRGTVKIKGKYCPIIGNICMNLAIVNINNVRRVRIGERVTVYDDEINSPNSIANSAQRAKTIPYTLLVNLSETTRRVLI